MNRDYIIKQTDENVWKVIDENGEIINTITKDTVINYCKRECEDSHIECLDASVMIDGVWWHIEDEYDMELVDNYCPEFDKFLAWFDYTCIEYLAKKMVAFYKQRLLNFE